MAASRSIIVWIPSEIILTDPLRIPTVKFITIKSEFDHIESLAVRVFMLMNIELPENTKVIILKRCRMLCTQKL
jgi:hypothetical protein